MCKCRFPHILHMDNQSSLKTRGTFLCHFKGDSKHGTIPIQYWLTHLRLTHNWFGARIIGILMQIYYCHMNCILGVCVLLPSNDFIDKLNSCDSKRYLELEYNKNMLEHLVTFSFFLTFKSCVSNISCDLCPWLNSQNKAYTLNLDRH